jgi:hypothetical protein
MGVQYRTEYPIYTKSKMWTRDRCQLEIWGRVAPKSSYAILMLKTSADIKYIQHMLRALTKKISILVIYSVEKIG